MMGVFDILAQRDRLRAGVLRVLARHNSIGILCEADLYDLRNALCSCVWRASSSDGDSVQIRTNNDPACLTHARGVL